MAQIKQQARNGLDLKKLSAHEFTTSSKAASSRFQPRKGTYNAVMSAFP
jgi:hypothetical protein